jgi:hypothetical protein
VKRPADRVSRRNPSGKGFFLHFFLASPKFLAVYPVDDFRGPVRPGRRQSGGMTATAAPLGDHNGQRLEVKK